MKYVRQLGWSLGLLLNFATVGFAADQMAMENTTPPDPEGALTAERILPLKDSGSTVAPPAQQPPSQPQSKTLLPDSTSVIPPPAVPIQQP